MMNYFILSLVSTAVLLGSGSCFTIKQNSTDEKVSIIGGEISNEVVPYHVFMVCDDNYFCGGALISPRHVLTAGHCVKRVQEDKCGVKVYAGSNFRYGGEYVEAEGIIIHPEFTRLTYEHDIGVITLRTPFTLSERIRPIALTPDPPINFEGITVTGYGRVDRTTNDESQVLKKYSSWLLTYEECYRHKGPSVFPGDFCDYGQKDIGTCQGDSGSPVVNDHQYLIGVVSRGPNVNKPDDEVIDCAVGSPNTFASVYYHMDFINECLLL